MPMPAPQRRIAVLGAGLIGARHARIAAEANALFSIIDIAPSAGALAEELGCAWFDGLDAALATGQIEGVIIATPNQLHVEQGLACIERGVPILVEKPIADNADDALRLVERAAALDVPILVGHHRRHNPIIKTAKAAVDDGRLGRLVSVHAQFWLYKPDDYFDLAWRRAKGAGPVFINLIHDIDLLRHLCGEVLGVQAIESNATRGHDVEDSAVVIMEFANGALGTISISDTVPAPWSWELTAAENPAYPHIVDDCYRIGGTSGSLSIPDLRLWSHPGEKGWWKELEAEKVAFTAADPLPLQFRHFLDVIDGAAKPLVSGAEGLQAQRIVSAIKRSSVTGVAQNVEPPLAQLRSIPN